MPSNEITSRPNLNVEERSMVPILCRLREYTTPSLENLRETNYSHWTDRIQSINVGAAATVTAFSLLNLWGSSQEFRGKHLGSPTRPLQTTKSRGEGSALHDWRLSRRVA